MVPELIIFDYSLINNSKADHSVKSFLDFWHSESVEIVSVCYFKLFSATLHSVGWYIFPFLFCLTFLCFSQLFVRTSQTTTLPSCISFSWGWFWSPPPLQCYKPLSRVLQAPCLPDLVTWIYLSPPLYNHKGFNVGHTWIGYWFSLLTLIWAWILQ